MTEKRFTVNYRENTRLYEVKDNLHILNCGGFAIEYNAKKCCEELNALHEENEQLKSVIDKCVDTDLETSINTVFKLAKKNEQLKKELAHHTRMHEWFKNEAYLLQNKLDNREDEIRRLKGDVE